MAKPRTKIKVDQLSKLPHYPDFVPDQIAKARSKIVDLIIGVVLVAAVGLGVYFARDELLGLMVIIALGWPFSIVIVLILITVPVCLVMAPYLIKRDDPK